MADIAVAARSGEDVERPLRTLAKEAASGEKCCWRGLLRGWKEFDKAERFWLVFVLGSNGEADCSLSGPGPRKGPFPGGIIDDGTTG
ncbi:MAG: hypothetical protein PSV46_20280 [Reyranella sp.]|nr:hypothetical protein [Reyranella sp.]